MGTNTQNITAQTLDEEITNAGVPPHGNQDPSVEEVANDDQALANLLALSNGDIRKDFFQMD